MRTVNTFFIFLSFCLMFLGSVCAQEFSADVSSNAGGQQIFGKIYNTPQKVRMEANGVTSIARIDKSIVWVLMPEQNKYMEVPMTASNVVAGSDKLPGEIERKLIGKETLDGKAVDKYRIVYTTGGKTESIFSWILPDSGIPAKTVAEDGSWQIEYRNINIASQPDSLFEVPSGYEKFAMPSVDEMMKNALKGAMGN
ncbi:MAG: hypothetical protein PHP17_04030 [Candidatus Omnitrophica bacterium]|nr:hypothetical protein [Candidatus Omnitrophota bacterium]